MRQLREEMLAGDPILHPAAEAQETSLSRPLRQQRAAHLGLGRLQQRCVEMQLQLTNCTRKSAELSLFWTLAMARPELQGAANAKTGSLYGSGDAGVHFAQVVGRLRLRVLQHAVSRATACTVMKRFRFSDLRTRFRITAVWPAIFGRSHENELQCISPCGWSSRPATAARTCRLPPAAASLRCRKCSDG